MQMQRCRKRTFTPAQIRAFKFRNAVCVAENNVLMFRKAINKFYTAYKYIIYKAVEYVLGVVLFAIFFVMLVALASCLG